MEDLSIRRKTKTDWLITIPKTVKWEDYEKELEAVSKYQAKMLYKVPFKPKIDPRQDKIFVLWNGKVRGWMECTEVVYKDNSWTCSTTGRVWTAGWYIVRSGPFHKVDGPEMRGFQGIRRFKWKLPSLSWRT